LLGPLFLGDERKHPINDAYNFYLSQMRIRIEMAFGLLCGKWAVLQRRLQLDLKNAGKLFMCCARLHNYVINERILRNSDNMLVVADPIAGEVDYSGDDTTFLASDVQVSTIPGNSIMRDILVQRISDLALVRPQYNLERCK
jgi:hypothetical protein